MEHIVVSNIRQHLDRNDILADEQHGFRSKRSCESQLLTFTQNLFKSISGGGQVDGIVLDFSKAFDKVPHNRLMTKLEFYGIRGDLLQWIEAFLRNRQQRVELEGCMSSTSQVLSVFLKEQ